MKQYLLTVVIFVFVGLNASENPFELNQNLQKIEKDQDNLLNELKKVSKKREAQAELEAERQKEIDLEKKRIAAQKEKEEKNTTVSENTQEDVSPVQKDEQNIEETRAQKIKEEQDRIEKERAQKEAQKKLLEEEKAAEAKRVEEEKNKKAERQKAEEKEAKELEATKQTKAEITIEDNDQEQVVNTDDINISQEELDAAKKAENLYLKAIKEVNKEN